MNGLTPRKGLGVIVSGDKRYTLFDTTDLYAFRQLLKIGKSLNSFIIILVSAVQVPRPLTFSKVK